MDCMALSKWIRWLYFYGLGGSATMEYSDFFLTSDSNYIFNSKINETVAIRYIVQPLNYSDMEIIETEKNKEMKELIFKYNLLCKRTHPIQTINKKEYIKLDRDKSTFKSHRDFSSEKEITFKHL